MITRRQEAGLEPKVKIQTKFRKKRAKVILDKEEKLIPENEETVILDLSLLAENENESNLALQLSSLSVTSTSIIQDNSNLSTTTEEISEIKNDPKNN